MDFFKSVFADDLPESDDSGEPQNVENGDDLVPEPEEDPIPNSDSGKVWSFGGLLKTLATKSESVIQTYRHDLEEFGSGLKKETAVIREVASRAVKDLPESLEAGAAVAQDSLESVGQAIDDIGSSVWKSTAGIINHGRDSLLAADEDSDYSDSGNHNRRWSGSQSQSSDMKPYSRFEAQVRGIQNSMNTFLKEPEDLESYKEWNLGFGLDEKAVEIENLMKEEGVVGDIYETLVPDKVDHETFWLRYFYRVHKVKEVEDARAKLVRRAISEEEEDLSWDFDDEDEDEAQRKIGSASKMDLSVESSSSSASGSESGASKADGKNDNGDSFQGSDVSIVSRPEEEYVGWDEIEEIGSGDENKVVVGAVGSSSSTGVDLRKRLSNAAEEVEGLSWDIEDDDDEEPSNSKS
ncbi:hypothetical protein UlMin_009425 [Ulmus minor]